MVLARVEGHRGHSFVDAREHTTKNGPSRDVREGPFTGSARYRVRPPVHESPRPIIRPRALLRRRLCARIMKLMIILSAFSSSRAPLEVATCATALSDIL